MRRLRQFPVLALAASVLISAACSSEPRPKAEPAPPSPATPAVAAAPIAPDAPLVAPGAAAADVEPTAEELPVREDFDDEAVQQITAKNFRDELAKLEKEIAPEAAAAPAPAAAPAN
jgi:PBP1b-binding outer membrane lipoprotein LpoB